MKITETKPQTKVYTALKFWSGNEVNGHWVGPCLLSRRKDYGGFYPNKILVLKRYRTNADYLTVYYQFLKDFPDVPVEDKYGDGWISPTGEFYLCRHSQGHDSLADRLAYLVYNQKPENGILLLEKYHWLRFNANGASTFATDLNGDWKITQPQIDRLVSLAMLLDPGHKAVNRINQDVKTYQSILDQFGNKGN